MSLRIGRSEVGSGRPLFVIAEIGLNHGGDLRRALALVDAAAGAGASAVKIQCLTAEELVAPDCPAPAHVPSRELREFFRGYELDEAAERAIASRARERGLAFVATPFDPAAVDRLERIGCDAYKIASGDLTNDRLIGRVAATGAPVLLSTGMASLGEVADALSWTRASGARDVALLHCVSCYPVPAGSDNLAAIEAMGTTFDVPVGLSDHGTDPLSAALTVAMGGSLYERHLMLEGDRGVDAPVSSTAADLADRIRYAERSRLLLGDGLKRCLPAEEPNLVASRRSLYARRTLRPGERITADSLVALRPARGLDPRRWRELVGRRATREIPAGGAFLEADLALHEERGVA